MRLILPVLCLLLFPFGLFAADFKPAILLNSATVVDKSFNESLYNGMELFRKKREVDYQMAVETDIGVYRQKLKGLAENGYSPIVVPGAQVQPRVQQVVAEVAGDYPGTTFIAIDYRVDLPNVFSVLFKEQEGSFLAGYLAALVSPSNVLGFIGGSDSPVTRRFKNGFRSGIRFGNPEARLVEAYVNDALVTAGDRNASPWNSPGVAAKLAKAQILQGVDIIFTAAGSSGLGAMEFAADSGKLSIGAEQNQNGVRPGKILTSVEKKLDQAVFIALLSHQKGRWITRVKHLGLAQGAIDLAMDEHSRSLITPDVMQKFETVKKRMLSGAIVVSEFGVVSTVGDPAAEAPLPDSLVVGVLSREMFPFTSSEGETIDQEKPGLIADLLSLLNQDLGVTIQLTRKPYQRLIQDIEDNEVDAIAMLPYDFHHDSISEFPKKNQKIDIGRRLFTERWVLFHKREEAEPAQSRPMDKAGPIAFPAGASILPLLQKSGAKLVETPSLYSGFEMLLHGRVPLLAGTELHSARIIKEKEGTPFGLVLMNVEKMPPYLADKHYYLAFSKEFYSRYSLFAEQVWNRLAQLRESPALWEASDKYFELEEVDDAFEN